MVPAIQRPGSDTVPVAVYDDAPTVASLYLIGEGSEKVRNLDSVFLVRFSKCRVARFEMDMERHHFTPAASLYGIRNRSQRNRWQEQPVTLQNPWPAEKGPSVCWLFAPSPVWPQVQIDAGAPSLYSLDTSRCSSVILGMAFVPLIPEFVLLPYIWEDPCQKLGINLWIKYTLIESYIYL